MKPITKFDRLYALELLQKLKLENDENYQNLKDKANWEKISLLAVLLQWGDPRDWHIKATEPLQNPDH